MKSLKRKLIKIVEKISLVSIDKSSLPLLEKLFQLYLHDISYYLTFELNSNGEFEAYSLSEWLDNKDNFGYFIYYEDKVCGFVMVDKEFKVLKNENALNLSEIFVLNSYKGKGIATSVLNSLFNEFKTEWEVRPVYKSKAAEEFWAKFFAGFSQKSELVEWKENRFAYIFKTE